MLVTTMSSSSTRTMTGVSDLAMNSAFLSARLALRSVRFGPTPSASRSVTRFAPPPLGGACSGDSPAGGGSRRGGAPQPAEAPHEPLQNTLPELGVVHQHVVE